MHRFALVALLISAITSTVIATTAAGQVRAPEGAATTGQRPQTDFGSVLRRGVQSDAASPESLRAGTADVERQLTAAAATST